MDDTKMTTGRVRLSYAHLFTPRKQESGEDKYGATLLIPKTDAFTLNKLWACMANAKQKGIEKGMKIPEHYSHTVYDGDGFRKNGEPFGPEAKGCYVISVSNSDKPVLIYVDQTALTEPRELYSGCYARAVINFFAYDRNGNKGISASLQAVMKLSDGEPLIGNVVTEADWNDGWTDTESAQSYPSQQQSYPQQQQGYPPQQQSYPSQPQQQEYPSQQQGYAPQQQEYPSQQQGYAPQQQEYPSQQQGYAPQQQGYSPQQQPGYYNPGYYNPG